VILEAFKPGTAPPDSYSVIGYSDQQQEPQGYNQNPGYVGVSPEQDRARAARHWPLVAWDFVPFSQP